MELVRAVLQSIGALIARIARVFGVSITPVRPGPPNCDDPGNPGCGGNPRICGSSQATVYGPTGALAEYSPPCPTGPSTQVLVQSGIKGLDSAARTELRFAPAPVVTIEVVHFSNPARIEAFQGPALADMTMMGPAAGVVQRFTLNGTAIDRIVVTPAKPNDGTLVVGWCH